MSGMRGETRKKYDRIARLFQEGMSRKEISLSLYVSVQTVERAIRLYGLGKEIHTFEEYREEIIEMYRQGMTHQEIAEETGLSQSTVSRNLRYMGIKRDKTRRRQKERKQEIFRAVAESKEEKPRPEQYARDTRQAKTVEIRGKRYQDVSDWYM